ncbi:hypothetical protein [Shewanella pneumatophori]|uniref:Uncharacterized protein n=1 Tax=Shewanella pneumatophori TaxID=314092 RepID=A0A9X1ZJF9_9GAMM|nr:hypothetical protein [Shewanella pneumatophori]MCL1140910.1 hypothetical protein [Shewanella pneumatophori]
MEFIDKILTNDNTGFMLLLGLVVVVLWFLPAMLAYTNQYKNLINSERFLAN